MSNKIDEEKLESLAKELAKGVKTEQDVAELNGCFAGAMGAGYRTSKGAFSGRARTQG